MAYILNLAPNTGAYDPIGYVSVFPAYTRTGQPFQFTEAVDITGAEIHIRTNLASTGAEITVRVETDSDNKPSGTLANANLTATIAGFNDQTYSWKAVTYSSTNLSANTKYWLMAKITSETGTDTDYRHAYSSDAYASNALSKWRSDTGVWVTDASADFAIRIVGSISTTTSTTTSTSSSTSTTTSSSTSTSTTSTTTSTSTTSTSTSTTSTSTSTTSTSSSTTSTSSSTSTTSTSSSTSITTSTSSSTTTTLQYIYSVEEAV